MADEQKEPTTLQMCLVGIVGTFSKYATGEGDTKTLTKADMSKLLLEELPELSDNDIFNNLMKDLDDNGDGVVDMQEFMSLICPLACVLHEICSKD